MEPIFDVPSQPTFTTFTTNFGVTFGTFICFESLWERAFELVQKVFKTLKETFVFYLCFFFCTLMSPTLCFQQPGWTRYPF